MLYTEKLAKQLIDSVSQIKIKAGKETYEMIISKQVVDRDWETIMLDGMDARAYKKNPVVLLDHSYKVENIVWKTISLKRDGDTLKAKFQFASTPNWQLAEQLYNEGILKKSSIWFLYK